MLFEELDADEIIGDIILQAQSGYFGEEIHAGSVFGAAWSYSTIPESR